MARNGEVDSIIVQYYCSAHHVDKSKLPLKLFIKFLLSYATSRHQSDNMGMISSLKVCYKYFLLLNLLDIFDSAGVFERAAQFRARQKRGKKGIIYDGKPHLLDCMNMLKTA